MCGRVIQKTTLGEIRVLFETVNAVPNCAPNYNGAPTQQLPVVRLDEERRRALDLHAVAEGQVTPEEGVSLAQIVEVRRRSIETAELEARIAALEEGKSR